MTDFKKGHPWSYYIRLVMAAALSNLTAAQIAESVNNLLGIPDGHPARLTHANCESVLNRMSGVSRVRAKRKKNKSGSGAQTWNLVAANSTERQRAETKRLLTQISRRANKLPYFQRVVFLKQCLAALRS